MFADSSAINLQSKALELGVCFFFSKISDSDEMQRTIRTLEAELDLDKRMKVLLHHKTNGCYLQAINRWTPLLHEALDFESVDTAIDFARDQDLAETVDIALMFMGNGQMFFFPVFDPLNLQRKEA
jgi:hypothetical protein